VLQRVDFLNEKVHGISKLNLQSLSTSNNLPNLQELSIVCMTKDRHEEFANVITYWRKHPVEFIISDGSDTRLTKECVRIESEKEKCHPNFVVKYHRESNSSARFKWVSEELTREFVAFNNDDDFLYAPNVEKAIDTLKRDSSIAGIYSWRNFSREYVSKKCKASVSEALAEEFLKLRIEASLDTNRNLPDAVWLSILRSENVKKALHDGYLAARVGFMNDRLSLNVLSIAFVMSNLISGKFVETDSCVFFKRSFDVDADWTLKAPLIKGYDLELRTEELRESTYNALKSTFVRERGIEKWQEIEECIKRTLWNCSAYEFDVKNFPIISWSSVSGKIRKEFQKFILPLINSRDSSGEVTIKPSLSSQLFCRWFRWHIWTMIHRKDCCKSAYEYLRQH
jgi:hypothetical protein